MHHAKNSLKYARSADGLFKVIFILKFEGFGSRSILYTYTLNESMNELIWMRMRKRGEIITIVQSPHGFEFVIVTQHLRQYSFGIKIQTHAHSFAKWHTHRHTDTKQKHTNCTDLMQQIYLCGKEKYTFFCLFTWDRKCEKSCFSVNNRIRACFHLRIF